MPHSHRRHDLSDEVWSRLEVHLPGRQGSWGGIARDNRATGRRIAEHLQILRQRLGHGGKAFFD